MKITQLGTHNNFAALNPPDWLAYDLAFLSAQRPTFKAMVLFADDLPAYKYLQGTLQDAATAVCLRSHRLQQLCQQHFGDKALFANHDMIASARRGYSAYNIADVPGQHVTDSLTGRSIELLKPNAAPDAAIFVLPPRALQPHDFVSETTGLPSAICTRFDEVNIHRAVLGHEWGHTLSWLRQPRIILWRTDERKADDHSKAHCYAQGDAATAEFFGHWRSLRNFLGPVSSNTAENGADTSDYWHDLHAAGHCARPLDEYAAQLEVKLLSMQLVPAAYPKKPAQFVRAAFNELADPTSMAICNARFSPIERLRALADAHPSHEYIYRHSETLASRIMQATGALAPGAL